MGLLLEDKAEIAPATVIDRKGADAEVRAIEQQAGLQFVQADVDGQALVVQHDAKEEGLNAAQGVAPGPDFNPVDVFPTRQGGHQTAEAEDVIKVAVREKNVPEIAKADAAAQDLTLGAFAAIDQEALVACQQHLCRQAPVERRGRCRTAKNDQFEHTQLSLSLTLKVLPLRNSRVPRASPSSKKVSR